MKKIIISHGAHSLISKFNNIFLGIYFLKLTEGNIPSVILFYLIQFICTPIFSYIVCRIINKNNILKIYRIGILSNSLIFVVLFLLGKNILNYIYLFAIIQNFIGMLYWESYKNIIYNFEGNEQYIKLNSYTNIVNNIISIFSIIGMGYMIANLSYIYLFLTIFIISFIAFLITFKMKIENIKIEKFSNSNIKYLLKDKQAKSIYRIVFFEGMGYCGALTTAIQLIIFLNLGTEFDLGILNALFSLVGIITAIIVKKYLKKDRYTISYIISAISIIISTIPILFSTKLNYFISYNIIFSIAYQITSILMNVAVFNIKENLILNKYRLEYTFVQESIHAIGKVIGEIILLFVVTFSYSLINMQIVVAILSITILFQAIEFRKYTIN